MKEQTRKKLYEHEKMSLPMRSISTIRPVKAMSGAYEKASTSTQEIL
jgi:hypothetical protein